MDFIIYKLYNKISNYYIKWSKSSKIYKYFYIKSSKCELVNGPQISASTASWSILSDFLAVYFYLDRFLKRPRICAVALASAVAPRCKNSPTLMHFLLHFIISAGREFTDLRTRPCLGRISGFFFASSSFFLHTLFDNFRRSSLLNIWEDLIYIFIHVKFD